MTPVELPEKPVSSSRETDGKVMDRDDSQESVVGARDASNFRIRSHGRGELHAPER